MGAISPPASGLTWLGAASNGLEELDLFQAAANTTATAIYQYYSSLKDPFDLVTAEAVRAKGMAPMITLEPWAFIEFGGLTAITSGAYDSYIDAWAQAAQDWGHPLFVRFAHEMNGYWYPWGTADDPISGPTGNKPRHYVDAWRRVHGRFGVAKNVTWVWAPNIVFHGSSRLARLYPGDDYVDWVGVDGYNWGKTQPWSSWQTFDQVFGVTITELARIASSKPLMITEIACAEAGGDKAAWITEFFAALATRPEIRGFVWFNMDKETDWRIQSVPFKGSPRVTERAFAAGLATLDLAAAPL